VRLRPLSLVATLWRATWRAGEGRGCVLCITASRLTTIDVIQSDAVCAKSTMKLRVTRSNSPSSCLSSGTARTCARPGPRPGPARTSLSCIENSDTNNSNIDRLRRHVVIPKWQRWHPLSFVSAEMLIHSHEEMSVLKILRWQQRSEGLYAVVRVTALYHSFPQQPQTCEYTELITWCDDNTTQLRYLLLLPAKDTPNSGGRPPLIALLVDDNDNRNKNEGKTV